MSQNLSLRSVRCVICLPVAAFALGLAMPAMAQGQAGANRPATSAQAAPPSVSAPPPASAVDALPEVPTFKPIPPTAIGTIFDMHLVDTVPPEDLAELRGDLILLTQVLGSISPSIAAHTVETGFTEERINALTDEEMTTYYNAMPDVPQFHMAVTALADILQHPTAQRNMQLGDTKVTPGRSLLPKMAPGTMALLTSLPFNDPLPYGRIDRGSNPIGGCPETRSDDAAVFALKIINNTLTIVATGLDIGCQVFIDIPCPVGTGGKFPPLCIASGVAQAAQLAFAFTIDQMGVCDTNFTNRTVQAMWQNSVAVHTNLDAHHMNIMDILTEFRELVVRTAVEENLLMNADQRLSMFQLPQGPHDLVSIQRTREIVLDTIQRNQLAGMSIGNAQTEFDAGEALLALNKYKDAYGRYRNAYRAAVGQTIR